MALKIYGLVGSRALRALWMLEEIRVPYTLVRIDFQAGDTRKPDYLRLNPNAKIPVMQDGDTVLFESMAINLYLAKKYPNSLWPVSVEDQGRVLQWTFWVVTEMETPLFHILINKMFLPDAQRDPKLVMQLLETLKEPFAVLNDHLKSKAFLLGETFTVADLNVAMVLNYARMGGLDLSPYPHVARWLDVCLARPALAAAKTQGTAA
jgi:glutathione S-transferase